MRTPLFFPLGLLAAAQSCLALQLNVTAIGARNGSSTLECWQMDAPFVISNQAGTVGSALANLGNVTGLLYSVIPAGFDGGVHNAPAKQWVVFTTGLAYITLPDDPSTSAHVSGGAFGVIFAADTADVSGRGHRTQYPGITETIALQIPTEDGAEPPHAVLHPGPCLAKEVVGLKELALGGSS